MSTKRILLAEDNPNDVELALAAFAELNLANAVVVVNDGVEALDYLRRKEKFADRTDSNPIVVLLDLKMPKLDGLEVLREMKGDAELSHIPVVILTSSREELDLVESYGLGVNGYVVKPVAFDQFLEAIKRIGLFWVLTNEPPPVVEGEIKVGANRSRQE
jgi:CheY-like chemotaxis protein